MRRSRASRQTRWLLGGGLLVVGLAASVARADPGALAPLLWPPPDPSPVARENALTGDPGWRLQRPALGALEAYVGQASVAPGEVLTVHARSTRAATVRWQLFRMGWYGGAEARRVAEGGPVDVGPRPTPAADPTTGLVACDWPATFTVTAGSAWVSGVYLFRLVRDDGLETFAITVVRDDTRRGAAVMQAAFTTYQAYNTWGGRSSYKGFAPELSFDRPYAEGHGAGQYFRWEHDFVRWAESRGYDLVYVASQDLDRDPALLDGHRLFLSVGHDEYWTRAAREHLEAALARGVSAAFLGSNAIYWQIRLEPSRDGAARPRRTQVCYKAESAADPRAGTPLETVLFRDPRLDWPENALLGVMYAGWNHDDAPAAGWVVRGAGSWVYEGTGVRDGDVIPGIVGYEIDRVSSNGRTPPGTEVLARSPYPLADGHTGTHEAAVHVRPSGAFVFATGSNDWAWGLSRAGVADARAQRVTENLFTRAGLAPTEPGPGPGAGPGSGGGAPGGDRRGGGCGAAGGAPSLLALFAAALGVWGRRRSRAGRAQPADPAR